MLEEGWSEMWGQLNVIEWFLIFSELQICVKIISIEKFGWANHGDKWLIDGEEIFLNRDFVANLSTEILNENSPRLQNDNIVKMAMKLNKSKDQT